MTIHDDIDLRIISFRTPVIEHNEQTHITLPSINIDI